MKSYFDKTNKYSKLLRTWKANQGMISLSLDQLKKTVKGKEFFVSEKIDGELECMHFNGKTATFYSKDGNVRTDMPVLEEIEKKLSSKQIKDFACFGDIAKTSSHGKPVHFNETMSAIRKPEDDEEQHIEFFPFELYEINGDRVSKTFSDYKKSFEKLKNLFEDSKLLSPVESRTGGVSILKEVWDKYVVKKKSEGIVVRTTDDKIYKSKPFFSFDLGVMAVQEGKGKNKNKMGALILGFYDGDVFYKTINLGVGFTDEDREEWWKKAKKYQVKKENNVIWIDPFKMNQVIETKYERLNYRLVDTFKFEKKSWKKVDSKFAATISKPDLVRIRSDKSINKDDLRLSQIPDFQSTKSNFLKKTSFFYEFIIESVIEGAKNEL